MCSQIHLSSKSCVMCQQVPEPTQRLTIFEKLQILRYAKELTDATALSRGSKKGKRLRAYSRGLNLQKMCANKFPGKLRGIKVCQMKQQAERQKWHLLTEHQQRRNYQLTDQLKLSLGLDSSVKGWKALNPSSIAEKLKSDKELPRWRVPAKVLEVWSDDQTC